jgi:hypothetical protein
MPIEQKQCNDARDNRGFSVECKASQFNVLQDISRKYHLNKEEVLERKELHQSRQEEVLQYRRTKFEKSIDQQRELYRQKLVDVRERKELHQSSQENLPIETNKQSLTMEDGSTYEKTTRSYIEITTGNHTTEITIQVKKDNGVPIERTTKYSGEASAIARLCNSKLDAFIQNNYHDALAQAKRKIEVEMSLRYAALGPTARASLEIERQQKIAEVEQKAGAALRNFLDKYGGRYMNSELLEELQWVEGTEACARDIQGRIEDSENKLQTSPEELQKITAEISNKIQEMKRLLPSSSAAPSENHALSGTSNTSSSEASHLSQDRLTLENFEQKIEAYMRNPTSGGLSDNIYKEILSLATDKRPYEGMSNEDKQKICKTLLDIGKKLADRQIKLDEPVEMLERWERYKASHYGRRLMYERQLVDHLEIVAKAASEHATAIYQEKELIKEVDRYYKIAGKGSLHPVPSGIHATELSAQFESTLAKLHEASDQAEQQQHIAKLVDLSRQVRETLQPNSLQISLEKLEKAHFYTLEKQQRYEHVKIVADKIQKLIELEKGRDDANDALELDKVNAIKETDKATLQYLRSWQQELVKHFYHVKDENHKALNKEEEEIRQFLIHLEKIDIGNQVQQKRMATMYWLSFFGSGDQAALVSLGRESTAEFSAFMGLFR